MLDLLHKLYGVPYIMRSVSYQWREDGGKVFGNVVGDSIDAADNGSEWDTLLVYLLKSMDAQFGLSRVKCVLKTAVNNFVLFQVLKVNCDFLLVVVCRVGSLFSAS